MDHQNPENDRNPLGSGAAPGPGSEPPPDPVQDPEPQGPVPGRRRWIVAAMGALAVTLFAVPLFRGPRSGDAVTVQAPGSNEPATCSAGKANFDFTMKDMKGADVRLSDYRGKVVLLNFWATWCGPCKVEIPEFVEVYEEYKDRGFEILGVLAMDEPSAADLQAFAANFRMNYPVLRANEDFENAHGPLWGLPTTFIIDRTGAICTKHMGPVSRDTVEREIKGLL